MNSAFEAERLYCTAGECLEEAVAVGSATVRADSAAAAVEGERLITFTLPLCPHHAWLLGTDATLVELRGISPT